MPRWGVLAAEIRRQKNVQVALGQVGRHAAAARSQKIVEDVRSLLSEPLASIFEFSLTLRSASPRLVLYRQLAEESLSSVPVKDDALEQISGSGAVEGTCCWVDTGNTLFFNSDDLHKWLEGSGKGATDSTGQPELFDFDHIYPRSNITAPVAIFYGAVGTKCFKELHVHLAEASKQGKVRYALRPVLPSGCQATSSFCGSIGAADAVTLSGYGVELALKNMEYKAMDDTAIKKGVALEDPKTEDLSQEVRGFIFSKILERKPELNAEIMSFRDYLLSSTVSDTLEVWELKDLGHQTAQRILHASDPLQSMQEINQNFPSVVSSLSRMKVDDSIKDEIIANQRMVPPGKSLMALNGALVNIEDLDLYLLMDMVREELSLADQFIRLKLPQSAAQKILKMPCIKGGYNLNELLMPVYPGQMRYIRKNLFHAVYVFDPASACGAETIDTILSLHQDSVPVRFGIIMYSSRLINVIEENDGSKSDEDTSTLIMRLFLYIKEIYSTQLAFQFLSDIHRLRNGGDDYSEEPVEVHHVEEAFVNSLLSGAKSHPQDVLLKLQKENLYKQEAEENCFVHKLGLYKLQCCLLMNGPAHEPNEDATMNAMNDELPRIQEQVYYGHIQSHTDVLEKFLSESSYKLHNPSITGKSTEKKRFVSLFASYHQEDSVLHDISYLHSHGSQHMGASSVAGDTLSAMKDKVYSLAAETALPVDDYKAWLTSFSADTVLKGIDKLSDFYLGNWGLNCSNAVITNGRQILQLITMLVSSSMSIRERPSERAHFEILNAEYSAIKLNSMNSSVHIDAVIDPLSPAGQKLSPLLRILSRQIQPSMRIVLNPILFSNMPLSKTLTMNIDVPEPWLVEPVAAMTLQAVYELEALLLTGHCIEKDREPPRGLQFILGTKQRPHLVDTLVMANLGYWQMKVSPGVWYLQLAPGRSADLYELPSKLIAIDSLRGKLLHIEVQKKKGKEHEDLLNADDDNHVLEKTDLKDARQGQTINIFSVASGHLYERFLKIMILSVLKKTQRPVKFWFIKNYLSPQFKDVIPHMALEYGFEYELITYKWPTWLHKQKEKQRIIWAYKILFLDVIFPLSLRKVIFVDADQIVRTDMENYQIIHGSKDPNSLSNLDQDLPNYAQHTVPIFSLPQEWLWCESWCGNATKARAKTIDLCNNPMTKEPKLQGAKRIVPEWVDFDAEARQFTARILGENVEEITEAAPPPSKAPKPDHEDSSQDVKDEL
ncbi:hypothetical protein ZWY2020_010394 [Hordeum vulgare]|nr:hypothetical protein ZWY2020_010394 [Hordeum vulgare]